LTIAGPILREYPDLECALDLLAWGGSASIGWPLLEHLVQPRDPHKLRDGVDLAATLRILERDGSAAEKPRFRMHRLVQEVRRKQRPISDQAALARKIIGLVGEWFQARRVEFVELPAFESELDSLTAWLGHARALRELLEVVRLQWLTAYPAWHRGEYERARKELESALKTFVDAKLQDKALEAHLRADMGAMLSFLGKKSEAQIYDEAALAIRTSELTEDNRDTAMSYFNLGSIIGPRDKRKALQYLLKALEIRRKVLGDDHAETGTAFGEVGMIYHGLGDDSKAVEFLTRALGIHRTTLGELHPETALSLGKLGILHSDLSNEAEALELIRSALDIYRRTVGEKHPKTATVYFWLGSACYRFANDSGAREFYECALKISKAALGERHEQTVDCYIGLLLVMRRLGDRARGFRLASEALHSVSPTARRYREIVNAYNDLKPPGLRASSMTGRSGMGRRKRRR
jgi:tetratricopeptide (TPR) repeat protein